MELKQPDAPAPAPAHGTITATFSPSHTSMRWDGRKTMSFEDFYEQLANPTVGQKHGPCYTPAVFTGYARRLDQAAEIDMAVLDSDCGHTLDEIADAVEGIGWLCIIHSTFNHLQTQTTVAAEPLEKWQRANPDKTVADYLVEKKGYLLRIAQGAEVVNETRDGAIRNAIIQHQPCPKYRVILPLDRPWVASSFSSQQAANTIWRERIGALAAAIGLNHDQSCVDTSRLFYLPRKSSPDAVFEARLLAGVRCQIFDLADAPAVTVDAPLLGLPVTTAARAPVTRAEHTTVVTEAGEVIDLTAWAAEYASRFQVVSAIKERRPSILSPKHRGGAKHHMRCPTAGDHITGGEDWHGTFAVNAGDMPRANLPLIQSGFYVHCSHAGCAGHDRLDFVRAMLNDGTLAVSDLTDERFLLADPLSEGPSLMGLKQVKAALGRLNDVTETPVTTLRVRAASKASAKESNIPPALYANLPGVMGSMHDFIVATAVKPQPALALASVLTFFGAALGRKAELDGVKVRANIYALAVAHSGAGKERLLSAPKQVAAAAGLFTSLIGVEDVASDSGIVNAVIKYPNQVCLIDEIGFLFQSVNNAKAGNHTQQVSATLLKLYSSSRTPFKSKSYADTDKVKIVDQPCVSILGCSTPRSLFSALSSKDVNNGLLSRFVMFDAGDNDPLGRKPEDLPPPQDVIDWLRTWNDRPLNENPLATVGMMPVIDPLKVQMTSEADAIAQAFEVEMHGKKIAAREDGTDALYVRARENALKFALVRGCAAPVIKDEDDKLSIDQSTLIVTADIMRWACELSRVTITAMEDGAKDEIVDTKFGQAVRDVRNLIAKSREVGMTLRDISRTGPGRIPQRELADVMKNLVDSGVIRHVNVQTKGRPRSAYFHQDFIEEQAS